MSPFDDDQDMRALDDSDELLLTGQDVPPAEAAALAGLAGFVAELRATALEPAPRPSAALGALLRDGLPPSAASARSAVPVRSAVGARSVRVPGWRHPWRTAAGLGLAAKFVLGAGVAVASVGGAATIDGVPDAVQRPARAVVSGVAGLFTGGPAVRDPGEPGPVAPVGPTSPTSPSPTAVPRLDPDAGVDDAPADGIPLPGVPLPGVPAPGVPLPEVTVPPLPASGRPSDLPTVVPDVVDLLRSGGGRSPVLPPSAVVPPARVGPPVADPEVSLVP